MPDDSKQYDEITILSSLDAIRLRPEMYLGPSDGDHCRANILAAEAMCDALHNLHCGTCKHIDVHLDGARAIIRDDGPGFSVEDHSAGMPAVEAHFTLLYACRDAKSDAAFAEKTCHGSIVTVTYLSAKLRVSFVRDGRMWSGSFKDGVLDQPFQDQGPDDRRFCEIEFEIDTTLVPDLFDAADLRSWVKTLEPEIDANCVSITPAS